MEHIVEDQVVQRLDAAMVKILLDHAGGND